ncbi:hypothetical protein C0993_008492 [Termitomyces sp. T159_Od127]|nr:hypothetical protein C0993_008492 [Termitomyces sp. T159_Od127]
MVTTESLSVYDQLTLKDSATNKTLAFISKRDHIFSESERETRWRPKCPKLKKPKSIGSANLTLSTSEAGSCEVGKLLTATNAGMPDGLLLDSAATSHMVAEKTYFTSYQSIKNEHI